MSEADRDELFRRNLAAFQAEVPNVWRILTSIVGKTVSRPVFDGDRLVNIDLGEIRLYPENGPEWAAAQTETYFQKPDRLGFDSPTHCNLSAVSIDLLRRITSYWKDRPNEQSSAYPVVDTGFAFVFGIGLGFHVVDFLKRNVARTLVLVEPVPEFLLHSLYAIDWEEIFRDAKEKGGRPPLRPRGRSGQDRSRNRVRDPGRGIDLPRRFLRLSPLFLLGPARIAADAQREDQGLLSVVGIFRGRNPDDAQHLRQSPEVPVPRDPPQQPGGTADAGLRRRVRRIARSDPAVHQEVARPDYPVLLWDIARDSSQERPASGPPRREREYVPAGQKSAQVQGRVRFRGDSPGGDVDFAVRSQRAFRPAVVLLPGAAQPGAHPRYGQ